MAQPIASTAVGRVNRRFLLLALILAALSAVLVYAAVSRSEGGTTSTVDVPVVVAKAAIPAGTTITESMVQLQDVPESAVGDQAMRSVEAVVGRTTRYPINANEQVLQSKVVSGSESISNDVLRNILEGGQRGMAIQVEAVIGAGGLVLPGDHVDVYWIPSSPRDDVPGAQLIAEDVEVVAVQQLLEELPPTAPGLEDQGVDTSGERIPGSEAEPQPDASTVTLMLTPEQASRVFCGDEGGTIRLAVRAFGDHTPNGLPIVDCIILGDNNP